MHIFDRLLVGLVMVVYPAIYVALSGGTAATAHAAEAAQAQQAVPPAAAVAPAPAVPEAPAPAIASDPEAADAAAASAASVNLEDVMEELAALRAQVLEMQQTLDTWFQTSLGDLKEENEALRRELREIYSGTDKAIPGVPSPNNKLIEDVLKESDIVDTGTAEFHGKQVSPEFSSAVAEKGYFPVAEWGLAPEDAAKSNPPRASLKGIIGAVFPGTPKEELEALGRRLRNEADAYDNINIQIFDDQGAAEAFKAGQSTAPESRVLTVSKFKNSGRDVILVREGDAIVEAPRDGE